MSVSMTEASVAGATHTTTQLGTHVCREASRSLLLRPMGHNDGADSLFLVRGLKTGFVAGLTLTMTRALRMVA
jgi:hypothetical protein